MNIWQWTYFFNNCIKIIFFKINYVTLFLFLGFRAAVIGAVETAAKRASEVAQQSNWRYRYWKDYYICSTDED